MTLIGVGPYDEPKSSELSPVQQLVCEGGGGALRQHRRLAGPDAPALGPLVDAFHAACESGAFLEAATAREVDSVAFAHELAAMATGVKAAAVVQDAQALATVLTTPAAAALCTSAGAWKKY